MYILRGALASHTCNHTCVRGHMPFALPHVPSARGDPGKPCVRVYMPPVQPGSKWQRVPWAATPYTPTCAALVMTSFTSVRTEADRVAGTGV